MLRHNVSTIILTPYHTASVIKLVVNNYQSRKYQPDTFLSQLTKLHKKKLLRFLTRKVMTAIFLSVFPLSCVLSSFP